MRIDLAVRLADDLLVLPDLRPRVAAERRRLGFRGVDLDPGDARLGDGRRGERERCEERRCDMARWTRRDGSG